MGLVQNTSDIGNIVVASNKGRRFGCATSAKSTIGNAPRLGKFGFQTITRTMTTPSKA